MESPTPSRLRPGMMQPSAYSESRKEKGELFTCNNKITSARKPNQTSNKPPVLEPHNGLYGGTRHRWLAETL